MKDASIRFQQLRLGEIDIGAVSAGRYAELDQDPVFEEHNWKTFYYLPSYDFIGWNTRDPEDPEQPHLLFGDARVRRAMTHLIDRDHLIAKVQHGFARKVTGPYFFKDPEYDESVPVIPYDPERARELLQGAGWKLNDEGWLEKDGRRFRFELMVLGTPLWVEPATVIAEDARKVGVDVQVKPVPPSAYAREFLPAVSSGSFDAFLVRNGLQPPIEPDQFEMFHSSLARAGAMNWTGLAHPRVDELLEETRTTFDRERRLELRRQFHRLFDEIHPFSVLYCTASCVAINRRWANVKVHDLGIWFRDFVLRELMVR